MTEGFDETITPQQADRIDALMVERERAFAANERRCAETYLRERAKIDAAHDNLREARAFTSWAFYGFVFWTIVVVAGLIFGAWARTARGAAVPFVIVTTNGYSDSVGDAAHVRAFRYTAGVYTLTVDGDGIFRAGFEASKVLRPR